MTDQSFIPSVGGRPRWEPTSNIRAMVLDYAGAGVRQDHIAAAVGVSKSTLQRRCRDELNHGRLAANAHVAAVAYEMAISGNFPSMTMFWLKCRMGWCERDVDQSAR